MVAISLGLVSKLFDLCPVADIACANAANFLPDDRPAPTSHHQDVDL